LLQIARLIMVENRGSGAIILTSMRMSSQLRLVATGVASLLVLFTLAPVAASSANISHSFNSDSDIPVGSLVSLDPKRTDYVQATTTNNAAQLLGVAVAANDSLLAVDAEKDKIQIATEGTANALVSDVNGDIKVGDQVAVSPFEGIGMKAGPGMRVVGLAQTDFTSDSDGATTQEIKDKDGKTTSVSVGFISLNIGLGTASTQGVDGNLNGIQKLTKGITGRTVSTWRAIVSLLIAVIATIALITLIYASIYGSIISIGRNPLAKYAVFRTLGSVLAMAGLTASVAGLTIFLLLH
jgi:hypothetical protein